MGNVLTAGYTEEQATKRWNAEQKRAEIDRHNL
jgi:hypothetical protein